MGWIFGFLIGAAVVSGGSSGNGALHQSLGAIPLRCFAAYDDGLAAYHECRAASMMGELAAQTQINPGVAGQCYQTWQRPSLRDNAGWVSRCDVGEQIKLEYRALTQLREAAAAAAKK